MAGEFLTPEQMRDVVKSALSGFAKWEMELLHLGVQEETLSHRLAIYIEQRLTGWQVDCEYNRNLRYPKMSLDDLSRMRPDIVGCSSSTQTGRFNASVTCRTGSVFNH